MEEVESCDPGAVSFLAHRYNRDTDTAFTLFTKGVKNCKVDSKT